MDKEEFMNRDISSITLDELLKLVEAGRFKYRVGHDINKYEPALALTRSVAAIYKAIKTDSWEACRTRYPDLFKSFRKRIAKGCAGDVMSMQSRSTAWNIMGLGSFASRNNKNLLSMEIKSLLWDIGKDVKLVDIQNRSEAEYINRLKQNEMGSKFLHAKAIAYAAKWEKEVLENSPKYLEPRSK